MKEYQIGGIQQIGIGVKNFEEAWNWYIKVLGMDCRIFEEEAEANIMLPFTQGKPRKRHAVLAMNLQGGSGFEIWQHKGKIPEQIKEEIMIGDLGILVCKIKVKDINTAFSFFKKNNVTLLCQPVTDPAGNKTFFFRDPFGNLFQVVAGTVWFLNENKMGGGSCGAIIGVRDIDRSKAVYSDILGYDEVVYDTTGIFQDLASLPGGNNEFRRILLGRSQPLSGYFSRMFGESEIELVSLIGKTGRKVYRDRMWGDPGFIHLCFDIHGMDGLKKYCSDAGFPFAVDSKQSKEGNSFDMGEAAGHFAYIEDPDGVLIEFVETHKIPVLKKFGWFIDLRKRNTYKPLPDWILKTLRFSRVKQAVSGS